MGSKCLTATVSQSVSPGAWPALVLNADFRPLSYYPLSVWSWQDTIKAVFLDRVNIVEYYERQVSSANFQMRLPSVVSLKSFIRPSRQPAFTRFNVFLRDRFACQYCRRPYTTQELTFDHVVPKSRGGRTSWANIVTACTRCNLRKSNRLPHECGMQPVAKPIVPTAHQLRLNGRNFPPNHLHRSWRDYLYWDVELDP